MNDPVFDGLVRAEDLAKEIVRVTTCPDPYEGGCVGGPIPGVGCAHEGARKLITVLQDVAKQVAGVRARALKDAADLIDHSNYYESNEMLSRRIRNYDGEASPDSRPPEAKPENWCGSLTIGDVVRFKATGMVAKVRVIRMGVSTTTYQRAL